MKPVHIIESPSEIGAGTRGASLGPEALKLAAARMGDDFFGQFPIERVIQHNELLFEQKQLGLPEKMRGLHGVLSDLSQKVNDALHDEKFPLVISGDHSNAAGTMAGVLNALPGKRIGVIWVDAHADLHSIFTTPSGNLHGMPLAIAGEIDNQEDGEHDRGEEAKLLWNNLKAISTRKIDLKDIVFIGLRDFEEPEANLIERYGCHVLETRDVREKGAVAIAQDAITRLSDCDAIYLTFDVDSMDPEISRGTGTPVPGGITEAEATDLLRTVIGNEKCVCMEITEVNPLLDEENKMGVAAFKILRDLFSPAR